MDQRPSCTRQKIQRQSRPQSNTVTLVVEEKNRIFYLTDRLAQNQDADHWANMSAERQRTSAVDKRNNDEKIGRRCVASGTAAPSAMVKVGCGVVIKGVDRDKWITISKIAVHFGHMCGHDCRSGGCL